MREEGRGVRMREMRDLARVLLRVSYPALSPSRLHDQRTTSQSYKSHESSFNKGVQARKV